MGTDTSISPQEIQKRVISKLDLLETLHKIKKAVEDGRIQKGSINISANSIAKYNDDAITIETTDTDIVININMLIKSYTPINF